LLKANVPLANIDFFEYSDNSTLHALLSLEAAGFAPRGQAWKLATDGSLALTGSLPVATMGGHMGRGSRWEPRAFTRRSKPVCSSVARQAATRLRMPATA